MLKVSRDVHEDVVWQVEDGREHAGSGYIDIAKVGEVVGLGGLVEEGREAEVKCGGFEVENVDC